MGRHRKEKRGNRKKRKKLNRALKKIKLVVTKEKLTAAAGLGTLMELFDSSDLREEFIDCLPKRVSHRSLGSYQMALTVMSAFLYGYDCLEDLEYFRKDPKLTAMFGSPTAAARTHGDFLRDFDEEHLAKLNQFLNRMSRYIFERLKEELPKEYKPKKLIIDMDSTSHVQHGNEMEGLDWNYKKEWCLDTQATFNQLGFNHGIQLRSGNTKSGEVSVPLTNQSFSDGKSQKERKLKAEDFFRADSAYCKQDQIRALLRLGVHFTLTAHDGWTGWKSQMQKEGLVWTPWEYSQKEREKAEARGVELPRVELSRFYWTPKWSVEGGKKYMFPIIVKRTWNEKKATEARKKYSQGNLFHLDGFLKDEPWDYYAVATNFPLNIATEKYFDKAPLGKMKRFSLQEVMEFHHKRANSENFLREEKYGFDLKHFPCQKLSANYAYCLLAQVAHNILRWVAIMTRPDRPHFSKKLRKHFIFIPGKIVYRSGQVFLHVMEQHFKGVSMIREAWGLPVTIPPQYSSA